jgi:hypothetical protein
MKPKLGAMASPFIVEEGLKMGDFKPSVKLGLLVLNLMMNVQHRVVQHRVVQHRVVHSCRNCLMSLLMWNTSFGKACKMCVHTSE